MMDLLRRLYREEEGQGLTEYLIILVVVAVIAFIFRSQLINLVNRLMYNINRRLSSFR